MGRALIIFVALALLFKSTESGNDELWDVEFQGRLKFFMILVVDLVIVGMSTRLKIGRGELFCTQSTRDTGTTLTLAFAEVVALTLEVDGMTTGVKETAGVEATVR